MVALPQNVNVEEHARQGGGNMLIPQGQYMAVAVESVLKTTSKGGQMVVMKFVVTQGEYQNTEFLRYLNIVNNTPKAVEIAYQEIANIGKAIGLGNVSDTSQLHNQPMIIEIKNKKQGDWTNNDGEIVEGKERSEIYKYLPIPAGGAVPQNAPAATQQESAPAQAAQTAQEQPDQAAAPANNPFAPPAG